MKVCIRRICERFDGIGFPFWLILGFALLHCGVLLSRLASVWFLPLAIMGAVLLTVVFMGGIGLFNPTVPVRDKWTAGMQVTVAAVGFALCVSLGASDAPWIPIVLAVLSVGWAAANIIGLIRDWNSGPDGTNSRTHSRKKEV